MHAVMRRVPAERARHAKRLGHVQAAPGPVAFPILADNASVTTQETTQQGATTATTASSQTVPTSASAMQSSSSALPSSSATHSSSSAPSSTTTSSTSTSTSTVASSASTQSPSPVAPSSSLITPSQPTTLTSTYPTSPTSTPQTNATADTSSGLSGGAIAGIIAGAIIVGVALIVFFVRKTYLRRRERKHISWNGAPGLGVGISDEPKFPDISEEPVSFTSAPHTPHRGVPLTPFETHGQSMYSTPVPPTVRMQPPVISTYAVPTPPPATYNNPTPASAYPTQPVSAIYSPGNTTAFAMGRAPSVRAQHAPVEAIVKCTFVPTLPDELSITTGERVFIVEEYDDGWDLCANGRGERGMVPRECLERAPSDQPDFGWRNARRMSSLNPDGRRF